MIVETAASGDGAATPVAISLAVGLVSTLIATPFAIATAWFLERSRARGRALVQTIVMLPLVLPPVVVGFLLLKLFSPRGAIGAALQSLGAPVAFHFLGAVVAAGVVGFPLYVTMVGLALRVVEPRLEVVSRSLGLTPMRSFLRVTLPLAWPGVVAGAVIAFARGLGEFGATIVLAGRIPGETETIPLRLYAELDAPGGESRIAGLVVVSIVLCLGAVVAWRALSSWQRRRLELEP